MQNIVVNTRQAISLIVALQDEIVRLDNLCKSEDISSTIRDFVRSKADDLRSIVSQAEKV